MDAQFPPLDLAKEHVWLYEIMMPSFKASGKLSKVNHQGFGHADHSNYTEKCIFLEPSMKGIGVYSGLDRIPHGQVPREQYSELIKNMDKNKVSHFV